MSVLLQSLNAAAIYVIHAPFFWGSMGFVTAVGMFLGSFIYKSADGKSVNSSVLVLMGYLVLALFSNALRIGGRALTITHRGFFAGSVTLVAVFLFYVFGLFLGPCIVKGTRKKIES